MTYVSGEKYPVKLRHLKLFLLSQDVFRESKLELGVGSEATFFPIGSETEDWYPCEAGKENALDFGSFEEVFLVKYESAFFGAGTLPFKLKLDVRGEGSKSKVIELDAIELQNPKIQTIDFGAKNKQARLEFILEVVHPYEGFLQRLSNFARMLEVRISPAGAEMEELNPLGVLFPKIGSLFLEMCTWLQQAAEKIKYNAWQEHPQRDAFEFYLQGCEALVKTLSSKRNLHAIRVDGKDEIVKRFEELTTSFYGQFEALSKPPCSKEEFQERSKAGVDEIRSMLNTFFESMFSTVSKPDASQYGLQVLEKMKANLSTSKVLNDSPAFRSAASFFEENGVIVSILSEVPFGKAIITALQALFSMAARRKYLLYLCDKFTARVMVLLQVLRNASIRQLIVEDKASIEQLKIVYFSIDDFCSLVHDYTTSCVVKQLCTVQSGMEKLDVAYNDVDQVFAQLHHIVNLRVQANLDARTLSMEESQNKVLQMQELMLLNMKTDGAGLTKFLEEYKNDSAQWQQELLKEVKKLGENFQQQPAPPLPPPPIPKGEDPIFDEFLGKIKEMLDRSEAERKQETQKLHSLADDSQKTSERNNQRSGQLLHDMERLKSDWVLSMQKQTQQQNSDFSSWSTKLNHFENIIQSMEAHLEGNLGKKISTLCEETMKNAFAAAGISEMKQCLNQIVGETQEQKSLITQFQTEAASKFQEVLTAIHQSQESSFSQFSATVSDLIHTTLGRQENLSVVKQEILLGTTKSMQDAVVKFESIVVNRFSILQKNQLALETISKETQGQVAELHKEFDRRTTRILQETRNTSDQIKAIHQESMTLSKELYADMSAAMLELHKQSLHHQSHLSEEQQKALCQVFATEFTQLRETQDDHHLSLLNKISQLEKHESRWNDFVRLLEQMTGTLKKQNSQLGTQLSRKLDTFSEVLLSSNMNVGTTIEQLEAHVTELKALTKRQHRDPLNIVITDDEIKMLRPTPIGQGATAKVYEAVLRGSVSVAMKRFHEPSEKIRVDGKRLQRFNHPNIMKCYGIMMTEGDSGTSNALVCELLKAPLREAIQSQQLSNIDKLQITYGIISAMAYLHSQCPQIIHCDIQPANVMLSSSLVAKFIDLGSIKEVTAADSISSASPSVGAIQNFAPEMVEQMQRDLTPRVTVETDVYSFGTLLFELWSGQVVWEGLSRNQIMQRLKAGDTPCPVEELPTLIPMQLGVIIRQCLRAEPIRRPVFAQLLRIKSVFGLRLLEAKKSDILSLFPGAASQHVDPSTSSCRYDIVAKFSSQALKEFLAENNINRLLVDYIFENDCTGEMFVQEEFLESAFPEISQEKGTIRAMQFECLSKLQQKVAGPFFEEHRARALIAEDEEGERTDLQHCCCRGALERFEIAKRRVICAEVMPMLVDAVWQWEAFHRCTVKEAQHKGWAGMDAAKALFLVSYSQSLLVTVEAQEARDRLQIGEAEVSAFSISVSMALQQEQAIVERSSKPISLPTSAKDSDLQLALGAGGAFKTVSELAAQNCKFLTAQGFTTVFSSLSGQMRFLSKVNFRDCARLDDACLQIIAQKAKQLVEVDFSGTRVGDKAAIKVLVEAHCTTLQSVSLENTRSGDDGIACLTEILRGTLKILNIGGTHVSDKGVSAIAQNCGQIEVLYVHRCGGKVTDRSIELLARYCSEIKRLSVGYAQGKVTDAGICQIGQHCKNLKFLCVEGSLGKIDRSLDELPETVEVVI